MMHLNEIPSTEPESKIEQWVGTLHFLEVQKKNIQQTKDILAASSAAGGNKPLTLLHYVTWGRKKKKEATVVAAVWSHDPVNWPFRRGPPDIFSRSLADGGLDPALQKLAQDFKDPPSFNFPRGGRGGWL